MLHTVSIELCKDYLYVSKTLVSKQLLMPFEETCMYLFLSMQVRFSIGRIKYRHAAPLNTYLCVA